MKNIYWMSLVSRISTIWKADTYKTHLSLSTREAVPKNLNFEVILLHRLGSIGIPIMELKYTKSSLYRGHWMFISPIQINKPLQIDHPQKENFIFQPSIFTPPLVTLPLYQLVIQTALLDSTLLVQLNVFIVASLVERHNKMTWKHALIHGGLC